MMLSLTTQAQTKCDWSDYSMFKSFQQENYFEYRTNIHWDSCMDYIWLLYDYQLKRTDTLQEIVDGAIKLQLNKKGKYQVQLKVINSCNGCDTVFYDDINLPIYGNIAKLNYSSSVKDCKSLTFEIAKIDTCTDNYFEIWDANEFTKNLTDKQWKEMSDSMFYFTYGWDGRDLIYFSNAPQRKLIHEFTDSGRYLVIAYWINKCNRVDTFTFNKIVVCPKEQTTSVKTLTKLPYIIGYYDMLGRQVEAIEPNKIYIILYSNGQRRKVMQLK